LYNRNNVIYLCIDNSHIHDFIMRFTTRAQAKKDTGLTALGSVNQTVKHLKAFDYNEMTYALYLSPANKSGYEVCPKRTAECTAFCLDESGMNRFNMKEEAINKSRIKKTKLFFEERQFFMAWLVAEITAAKRIAEKKGYTFSVRLNNTSDLSPEQFYMDVDGRKMNILQLFPDVTFYDYTKVANRMRLLDKYPNYDLTFSYSGENLAECMDMLQNDKARIAVVFRNKLPETFWGREVVDGDLYDMRYKDAKNVIVGLKFKIVRKKLQTENKFVVTP
jgi:hypothetical protein